MALSVVVLHLRDFRLLLLTRTFGAMALQAQAVIVGWQIYSLTHNVFLLGLTGLAEAVPAITCALWAGHVVDSYRPYQVFISCITVLALNMLALLLVGGGIVPLPHGVVIPWIFAGVFISGLARSFIIPASFALQTRVIPRAQISAAAAWLSGGMHMGVIAGPAIAGLVYGGYGPRIAWLLPVSLMSLEFMLACAMGAEHRHFTRTAQREPVWHSMREGAKFIRHNGVLLSVMALDMFAVLFGGAVAMLPAYADRVLHVGSGGLGALRAATAIGAILATLLLALKPMQHIRGSMLLWVVAGFGLCIIGFGLSHWFWLSMLFLALSGIFDSVSMVIRGTLVQLLTPEAMRGRVSAVNSMFIISSNEIGAFESGLAAQLLGLVPSIVFGGVGTLLVVAVTAIITPSLRRLAVRPEDAKNNEG